MYLSFSLVATLILIVAVIAVIMGTCAYLILLERKIAAWVQDRVGPNRAGPLGLLQPIADGIKFLLKEQIVPSHVDKLFYMMGPAIALTTALMAIVVVPLGRTTVPPTLIDHRSEVDPDHFKDTPVKPIWPQTRQEEEQVLAADEKWAVANGQLSYKSKLAEYNDTVQFVIAPHVDIGIVLVFAIGSLAVYAIVLGGWSSNNKYSFMGSLRSSAQLISYEFPMGLSVLGVFLVTGSLNLEQIIEHQYLGGWNVLFQPLACLLFITAVFAECNRLPFDLPEAEQELVGGYHTEYSGMKFALYFLGEYSHMVTTSFLVVAVFFGGWLFPGVAEPGPGGVVIKLVIFGAKMILFICFYMVIRWTIPRFRFDQLMGLAWKSLLPLGVLNLVFVLLVQHYRPLGQYSAWLLLPLSVGLLGAAAYVGLVMPGEPARASLGVYGHGTGRPVVVRKPVRST
jgi:NADH-quinone oxidoreductase subunit H